MSPFVILFLGLWLLTGHFAFGYHSEALVISDSVAGVLLLVLGCFALPNTKAWVPWAIALVGVWLEAAPLLFWSPDAACYVNDTLIGALVVLFSILIPPIPGQLPDVGASVPPGWNYNPSAWPQRIPIAALACVGWFISRYLAAYQLGYIDQIWDPVFGEGTLDVITSSISRSFPVSDAGLGAMAYTLEVLLTCKGGVRRWRTMPWMVVVFGILVVPLGLTSIVLIVLQPVVVGAWCFLCLVTALCMVIMVPLAIDEVAAVVHYLQLRKGSFWRVFFQGGTCPGASRDRKEHSFAVQGVTLRKSLAVTAGIGVWLMITPWVFELSGAIADWDHILGPFAVVTAAIATADVTRKAHYLNGLFALLLLIVSIVFFGEQPIGAFVNHLGIIILLFSLNSQKN